MLRFLKDDSSFNNFGNSHWTTDSNKLVLNYTSVGEITVLVSFDLPTDDGLYLQPAICGVVALPTRIPNPLIAPLILARLMLHDFLFKIPWL